MPRGSKVLTEGGRREPSKPRIREQAERPQAHTLLSRALCKSPRADGGGLGLCWWGWEHKERTLTLTVPIIQGPGGPALVLQYHVTPGSQKGKETSSLSATALAGTAGPSGHEVWHPAPSRRCSLMAGPGGRRESGRADRALARQKPSCLGALWSSRGTWIKEGRSRLTGGEVCQGPPECRGFL